MACEQNRLADAVRALRSGRVADAERTLSEILREPNPSGEAFHLMGAVSLSKGAVEAALSYFRRAVGAQPDHAVAHYNLGKILLATGKVRDGVEATRRATVLKPGFAQAWNNLGNGLTTAGECAEAIEAFGKALALDPENASYWNNAVKAHRQSGAIGRARQAALRATGLAPDNADAWLNLAAAHIAAGAPGAARMAAERAEGAVNACNDPNGASARSLIAGLSHYIETDATAIARAHRRWAEADADPITPPPPDPVSPDPDRVLAVGYVSSDFRRHSVAHFLMPLFAHLKHRQSAAVRIVAFSDVAHPDAVTASLRDMTDRWIDLTGRDDNAAFDIVKREKIDILVDLAGPTLGNRHGVFARRPAPVQASWLGFPGSTGMCGMDWRIADGRAAPPDEDGLYPDRVWRLPDGYHCFAPLHDALPGPIDHDRPITFGCFNHIAKISTEVMQAWAKILNSLDNARLLIKSDGLSDPVIAREIAMRLSRAGVDRARVRLEGRLADPNRHLSRYNAVDLALDTFPYNGTTTTCEALWMGVPVTCLAGHAPAGRVGESLLASAGASEFVAASVDRYVDLAIRTMTGGVRDQESRLRLRGAISASTLCDGAAFAAKMEQAFRGMWRDRLATHR